MPRHRGGNEPFRPLLVPHPEPPRHLRTQQHDHLPLPHHERIALLTFIVTAHHQQGLSRRRRRRPLGPRRRRRPQVQSVEAPLAAGAVGDPGAPAAAASRAAAGPRAELLRVRHVAGGFREDVGGVLPAGGC